MAAALALLSVVILVALVVSAARGRKEAFTPVVRLTTSEAAYAATGPEWEKLQSTYGSGVEFRTVLEVEPPMTPPSNPAASSARAPPPTDPPIPPTPVGQGAPAFQERPLVPPARMTVLSGPRIEVLVDDVVKARYAGPVTAAGLLPWVRLSVRPM